MTYRCDNCGDLFAEPISWREDGEPFNGSPCCHYSYEELKECDVCGEFYAGDTDECPDCLHMAFERFVAHLETYREAELLMLDFVLDGESLTKPTLLKFPME